MDLTKLLLSQMGDDGLSKMASQIGASTGQTQTALEGVVPALLGGMTSQAQSQQGAMGILGMLDQDGDGDIFDDLSGFLGKAQPQQGEQIANKVLGTARPQVEEGLSNKTSLNTAQISQLISLAAPIVLGYLTKQKKQGGLDAGGLANMLGGLTQGSDQGTSLDLGDVFSTINAVTGSGEQKSGGLGGMLGNLFKG